MGLDHDGLKVITLLYFHRLIPERVPGFEIDHFLAGVRQTGDLPGRDRIDKFVRDAVTGLVDILAHVTHDREEFMFFIVLSHELQDVELVLRQFCDSFLCSENACDRFRPVVKLGQEPIFINSYLEVIMVYHRHRAFSAGVFGSIVFETNICLTRHFVNTVECICQAKVEMSYSYQSRNVRFLGSNGELYRCSSESLPRVIRRLIPSIN